MAKQGHESRAGTWRSWRRVPTARTSAWAGNIITTATSTAPTRKRDGVRYKHTLHEHKNSSKHNLRHREPQTAVPRDIPHAANAHEWATPYCPDHVPPAAVNVLPPTASCVRRASRCMISLARCSITPKNCIMLFSVTVLSDNSSEIALRIQRHTTKHARVQMDALLGGANPNSRPLTSRCSRCAETGFECRP